jgi:hypothetical protein
VSHLKRTTHAESVARAAPWSTRAVILIAFAIQLMPVSERSSLGQTRPADRLMVIDGRLAAIWITEGAAHAAAAAVTTAWAGAPVSPAPGPGPRDAAPLRPVLRDWAGCALLPMPPPQTA